MSGFGWELDPGFWRCCCWLKVITNRNEKFMFLGKGSEANCWISNRCKDSLLTVLLLLLCIFPLTLILLQKIFILIIKYHKVHIFHILFFYLIFFCVSNIILFAYPVVRIFTSFSFSQNYLPSTKAIISFFINKMMQGISENSFLCAPYIILHCIETFSVQVMHYVLCNLLY